MFVYKVSDLQLKLQELSDDGFEYVTLLSSSDDDGTPYINFEGVTGENSGVDYEDVDAVILPESYSLDK